jgi:toxin ParE1/3/4
MARYRLSRRAQNDLTMILGASADRWGEAARRRYAATVAAALRQIAGDPRGPLTRAHGELLPGLRSFHLRHAHPDNPTGKVGRPVHILYYRAIGPELIEIVRVMHERMQPIRHIAEATGEP